MTNKKGYKIYCRDLYPFYELGESDSYGDPRDDISEDLVCRYEKVMKAFREMQKELEQMS